MSKMSQLHAELSEQASELGFQSIEEAEANGYAVDYEKGVLVDGQTSAHNEWLKEREEVLDGLLKLRIDAIQGGYEEEQQIIDKAIEFIRNLEEGE